jgi:ERCC4-type nuclease
MINIIVDDREAVLYQHLEGFITKAGKSFELTKKTLALGDIVIEYIDNSTTKIFETILERKTLTDLLASIRDGRYDEQSHRLIHSSGVAPHNIIYLIEGIMNTVSANDKNLIHSTMTSLNVFKGFSVMRTTSVQETAEFIVNMAGKIQRNIEMGKMPCAFGMAQGNVSDVPNNSVIEPYCNVVKKVKKDNVTSSNIGEIILCQIPSVSSVSAVAIMKKFKTIKALIEQVSQDPACMNDIVIVSGNGSARKLSKTIIQNIRDYLCRPPDDQEI